MRAAFFIICISVIFINCKSSQSEGFAANTADKRFGRRGSSGNSGPDSVIVTGAQYIPMYGKSETGVNPDLEGTWEMETMDGYAGSGNVIKKLDSLAATKFTTDRKSVV